MAGQQAVQFEMVLRLPTLPLQFPLSNPCLAHPLSTSEKRHPPYSTCPFSPSIGRWTARAAPGPPLSRPAIRIRRPAHGPPRVFLCHPRRRLTRLSRQGRQRTSSTPLSKARPGKPNSSFHVRQELCALYTSARLDGERKSCPPIRQEARSAGLVHGQLFRRKHNRAACYTVSFLL
jgi:hypothetical protein